MPLNLTWQECAIRLALAVLAGAVLGFDREARGRAAGLRTTILVSLAAAVAMLQVNALIGVRGKASDSFVVMDLMRLPLGILTGVGFIGAGAILRRDGLVVGITTAATMWYVTVVGLCFGGGQLGLGGAALALGWASLSGLRWADRRIRREQRGVLVLETDAGVPTDERLRTLLEAAGCNARLAGMALASGQGRRDLRYEVRWQSAGEPANLPALLRALAAESGIQKVRWRRAP